MYDPDYRERSQERDKERRIQYEIQRSAHQCTLHRSDALQKCIKTGFGNWIVFFLTKTRASCNTLFQRKIFVSRFLENCKRRNAFLFLKANLVNINYKKNLRNHDVIILIKTLNMGKLRTIIFQWRLQLEEATRAIANLAFKVGRDCLFINCL